MNTKEKIKVMQHYEDGGKIEVNYGHGWHLIGVAREPSWDWIYSTYRIYEEPNPKDTVTIEKWLCQSAGANKAFMIFDCEIGKNISMFEKVKLLDTYEVTL